MYPEQYELKTHCMIPGQSGSRKSAHIEAMVREHIWYPMGALRCIPWHRPLYEKLVAYCAYAKPKFTVRLIDFSRPQRILPWNIFCDTGGADIAVHASRIAGTIARIWGAKSIGEVPTYFSVMKTVVGFCADRNQPICNAAELLKFENVQLRAKAIDEVQDSTVRDGLIELQRITRHAEWKAEVRSTQNRLGELIQQPAVRRFFCLPNAYSLNAGIEESAFDFVNICPSNHISYEAAKIAGSLMLNDRFHTAISHSETERPSFEIIDEASNLVGHETGQLLDQIAKAGGRLTLGFHHLQQFGDDLHLLASLRDQCGIKIVHKGMNFDEAKRLVQDVFPEEVDRRWIKDVFMRKELIYGDTVDESETETEGDWPSFSRTMTPRFGPVGQQDAVSGITEFSLEEKLTVLAHGLVNPDGDCWVIEPDGAFEHSFEWMDDYARLLNPAQIVEFKDTHSGEWSDTEADQWLQESRTNFLKGVSTNATNGSTGGTGRTKRTRPAKKRATVDGF